ncbi:MAG: aldo/keto reductase [Clostridia bacterium]|nr:aldo/keto reductase [Clostridia bacterium]
MNYRSDKYGNPLAIIGFGCMRFPKKMGATDVEETEHEIMLAIENGVNYFDTAYIYPKSEAVLGEILEKNGVREKVNIATKLPHYLIKKREDFDRIFNEELKRLRTDHVDYYLMHMLTDIDTWNRLLSLGAEEWLAEKQASGAIRQVGFSYHGNPDMFCRLVDARNWDFCMIQYNYMDEYTQAGRRGLEYANKKGLPVMIMEPLRGGKLASPPEKAKHIMERYKISHTPAQWSFLWLWSQPEVTVVLSGMNSEAMVLDNIKTACSAKTGEIGEAEKAMLAEVVKAINSKIKVGCTGCGYCVPCPKNVDIPGTFAAYNRASSEGKIPGLIDYFMCTALRPTPTSASQCVGCGRCEKRCPQKIEIRKHLKEAEKMLEGPLYKIGRNAAKLFVKM